MSYILTSEKVKYIFCERFVAMHKYGMETKIRSVWRLTDGAAG